MMKVESLRFNSRFEWFRRNQRDVQRIIRSQQSGQQVFEVLPATHRGIVFKPGVNSYFQDWYPLERWSCLERDEFPSGDVTLKT